MKEKASLVLYFILIPSVSVQAFEPISTSILTGAGVAVLGKKLYNYLVETCNEHWVGFNKNGKRSCV
ncbi:torsin-1A-like isoform X2 [Tachysurus ichikawai]